ncbi:MAG: hypothetical protein IH956_08120 [Chloroflexi bacterium]|nr:hypothetical protein [Chloroflexota bacterium]
MRIGVVFPQTEIGADPAGVRDYAQAAESLGYDHLIAFDHVLPQSKKDDEKPDHELDKVQNLTLQLLFVRRTLRSDGGRRLLLVGFHARDHSQKRFPTASI